MSVNSVILDEIIGHSVDLSRLEVSIQREVVAELKKLEKQLIKDLEASKLLDAQRQQAKTKRLAALLKQTKETIATAYKEISKKVASDLSKVAAISEAQSVGAINTAIKAEVLSVAMSKQQLKSIVSNTLIEGAPSEEWWSRRSVALRGKFTDTVRQGMLRGDTTSQIVSALRGTKANRYKDSVLNGNYRSAEALVRTSVQSVANDSRLQTFKDNSDIIKGIEWVSTLDNRTSDVCQALDGAQWDLNGNPLGHDMVYPGGTAHWGCRSTTVAITKSFKELGSKNAKEIPKSTRASMDGQVSEKKGYEAWLKTKPKSYQEQALGVKKRKLWDEGKLGFSDLTNQAGNPLTLDQLETKLGIK